MRKSLAYCAAACLLGSLVLNACKKNEASIDKDTVAASDNNLAETNFDAVFVAVDNAARSGGLHKAGPAVLIDTISNPRRMTIDYGSTDMNCTDGKVRRGKIMVTWNGSYRDNGTVITIGFDKFFQNGNSIQGSKTITNNGRDANQHLNWTINVTGARVITPAGDSISWSSVRTRTWVAGEDTSDTNNNNWANDEHEVTGTVAGTNRKGVKFTVNVTKPLQIKMGCLYRIVGGVVDLLPEGKQTRTIDYGSGTCDATITVYINGKTYIISKN